MRKWSDRENEIHNWMNDEFYRHFAQVFLIFFSPILLFFWFRVSLFLFTFTVFLLLFDKNKMIVPIYIINNVMHSKWMNFIFLFFFGFMFHYFCLHSPLFIFLTKTNDCSYFYTRWGAFKIIKVHHSINLTRKQEQSSMLPIKHIVLLFSLSTICTLDRYRAVYFDSYNHKKKKKKKMGESTTKNGNETTIAIAHVN